MKLRHVVLLLVLANLLYWGWAQGLLRDLGLGPTVEANPGLLADQIAADAVSVQAYVPPAPDAGAAADATRAPAHASDANPRPAERATPPVAAAAGTPAPNPAGGGESPSGSAGHGALP